MDKQQLKNLLNQSYDRERWFGIVREVFPHTAFYPPQSIPCDHADIEEFMQIGDVRLHDGKNLALFEIKVSDKIRLPQNRVALRNIVTCHIDQQTNHGVLVIFDSHSDDFRFTFAAKESKIDDEGGYLVRETPPRRYTYVLGPNESCRTAADRFHDLSLKRESAGLDDVKEAFSVEKLNKEFFKSYKKQYDDFTDYLVNSEYRQSVFKVPKEKEKEDQSLDEKPIRDFVKRLLGRIVFLHFLQKKGWLGCPPDRSGWKDGNPDFMYDLFETCPDKDHFHSKYLMPLFHKALNTPGRPNDLFKLTGTRIPYLNGGLFERDLPDVSKVDFPPEYFRDLLNFFRQYNFTIDENDPEDHEIGIDPEMLGHIFENLLEDNKDKGAYYTPKAIVEYMGQESLIQYLKTHLGDHPEIEDLVRTKTRGDEKNRDNFIVRNARRIEELLDNVKICDPAIGSGAFPIGLLKEIYWIKLALDLKLDRAEVKRLIIQNSIYGVDIDAGAVEIARLRFWLALIVDEKEPTPLPNLDYKIMQGNSLFESFHGVDFSRVQAPDYFKIEVIGQQEFELPETESQILLVDRSRQKRLPQLVDQIFATTNPKDKAQIRSAIDAEVRHAFELAIQHRREQLLGAIANKKNETPSRKREKQIVNMKTELNALSIRLHELYKLQDKPERPYFLWHLYFQEVFSQDGFDIVIANPPYVRQESIRDQKPALEEVYDCYTGTADLFVYFYELAVRLLKDNGILTYISSNKYYRSAYGTKLREYLTDKLRIHQMIDFGDAPVFEAISYASIFIGERNLKIPIDHELRAYTWQKGDPIPQIGRVFRERSFKIKQKELLPDGWQLESPEVFRLLEKLRKAGTPLGEYVKGRFYYGIKTGLNEAFVVDRATRDRLIAEDPKSDELLKPFLRGRDIKRWRVDFAERYLILIESSENKKHPWTNQKNSDEIFATTYPSIAQWLSKFKRELIKRCDKGKYYWELRSCAYYEEFEKPKILYPDIYEHQSFCYDIKGFFSANTTYFIPSTEVWLTALLNSTVIEWFYGMTSNRVRGGYLRAFTEYIQHIPIPKSNQYEQKQLSKLTEEAAITVGLQLNDIENHIDEIVYRLFKLSKVEIKLIESSINNSPAKDEIKSDLRSVLLPALKKMSPYFEIEKVHAQLEKAGMEVAPSTLKTYLSQFTTEGVICDAGRGWYSRIENPFVLDTKPVKKIITKIKKAFPLLDFSCWSTEQINPYTQHVLNRFVSFVYADPDTLGAIAEELQGHGYAVLVDPGKKDASRDLLYGEHQVVLRKAIRKQPQANEHAAPIEKILVDLRYEAPKLNLMDQAEVQKVVENVVESGRVNLAALLGYAGERRQDFGWYRTIYQLRKT